MWKRRRTKKEEEDKLCKKRVVPKLEEVEFKMWKSERQRTSNMKKDDGYLRKRRWRMSKYGRGYLRMRRSK